MTVGTKGLTRFFRHGSVARIGVTRIIVGVTGIALVLVAAVLPIWRMRFLAPQYPAGLGIEAYGDRVDGDLNEITVLSHYIGMPRFDATGMPEMTLWPYVILLAVLGVIVATAGDRAWWRRLACTGLWLIPVGALADVQFRLWQMGHNLDGSAPLTIDSFTPLVVGPTMVMNFTMWGIPGSALALIAAAATLVTFAPAIARRIQRRVPAPNAELIRSLTNTK